MGPSYNSLSSEHKVEDYFFVSFKKSLIHTVFYGIKSFRVNLTINFETGKVFCSFLFNLGPTSFDLG